MAKKGAIRIGTSGWMYKDWGPLFYPQGMKKGFLTFLAGEFNTVEINSSFYHLPLHSTFEKWRDEVPDDFQFAVKMSRYITHRKKLVAVTEPVRTFFNRSKQLREKLGPILIQLPPFLRYDEKTFDDFLVALKKASVRESVHPRLALEPRHHSWLEEPQVSAIREKAKAMVTMGLVFPHSAKIPSVPPEDENILSDFVYVRFHGPSEFAASRYGAKRLQPWAGRILRWQKRGLDVYAYFNNDVNGHAIIDAQTLVRLLHE